ncbi:hypothetical protein, partial [Bizionia paragorgiae]|uniref:hypothetical protein n=1 Tax=Bizionia paragorgiae TaxID=283786 RepID=UPI003A910104
MKKRLFILLLFYSFLGFGQEYGIWFTTIDYYVITRSGGNRLSHAYIVTIENIEGTESRGPNIGVYKKNNNSFPIKMTPEVYGSFGAALFKEEKELGKYEYYVGGSSESSRGFGLETTANFPSDLEGFHFYAILLPFYEQPIDNNRTIYDLLFKTTENTFIDPIKQVPEIIWKYNYDNNGFVDFPEDIKYNFPMKSSIGEILKNETIEVNKSLKIKAVLDNSSLISNRPLTTEKKLPIIETTIFSFNIISSSPELKQNPPVSQSPSCNYRADGSLTLDFKRDLYTTEKLAVIIYQQNTESGEYDVILDQKLDIES